MNRFRAGALALSAATVLAVMGLPGQAMAASTAGTEHFTIVLSSPSRGPVLAYGAFNAKGTDVEGRKTGATGTSSFQFANGNIAVRHTDDPGGTFTFNPKTCVGHFTGTGDYVLTGGTGAYKGIDGHGEYTVSGTQIGAHTANGCSKQPIGGLTIVHASGWVSSDS
jgi:hypothetical protein